MNKLAIDNKKDMNYYENMDINSIPIKYRHDIETATNLLKKEGCKTIYLFGSLVTGKIREDSDIDIGISGLPAKKYFTIYSKLDSNLSNKFDLVDFDVSRDFYNLLKSLNEVIEIG
ncbi:hypothetical protein AGMMS50268_12930 [Spirochaetia bacterium]|nr:hypothetical protein AGMMS50268_12930 [Spirochaetia bacterium]